MNQHDFANLVLAFVFKSQAYRLHAALAIRPAVALEDVDVFRPETNIAVVAVGRAHNVVDYDKLFAVRATEAAASMFMFP
jgi:hypothetical protein